MKQDKFKGKWGIKNVHNGLCSAVKKWCSQKIALFSRLFSSSDWIMLLEIAGFG